MVRSHDPKSWRQTFTRPHGGQLTQLQREACKQANVSVGGRSQTIQADQLVAKMLRTKHGGEPDEGAKDYWLGRGLQALFAVAAAAAADHLAAQPAASAAEAAAAAAAAAPLAGVPQLLGGVQDAFALQELRLPQPFPQTAVLQRLLIGGEALYVAKYLAEQLADGNMQEDGGMTAKCATK